MQEAIGPQIIGQQAIGQGGSLTDGPCGYSCGLGSKAFEYMMGKGTDQKTALKAQAKELAYAQTELIEQIPIGIYQLKAQRVKFTDKITNDIREEETLVSSEFGPISHFTDAGEHGTGSSDSYTKILNRAHELAKTDGTASMLWISPGVPVRRDDGVFVPETRAYLWKKDALGNVNAYQYSLTGSQNSLSEMMKKLGYKGKVVSLENQVIVRKDTKRDFTHQEVFSAFESSLTQEENITYKAFLDTFRIDAKISDAVRIGKMDKYQEIFEKKLVKSYKEDIQTALEHVVHGLIGMTRISSTTSQTEKSKFNNIQSAQHQYEKNTVMDYIQSNMSEQRFNKDVFADRNEVVLAVYNRKKKKNVEIIPELEEEHFTPISEQEARELSVYETFIDNSEVFQEEDSEIREIIEIEEDIGVELEDVIDSEIAGLALLQIDQSEQDVVEVQIQLDEHSYEDGINHEEKDVDFDPVSEGLITPALIHLIEKVNDQDSNEETEETKVIITPNIETGVKAEKTEKIEAEVAIESILTGLTLLQIDKSNQNTQEVSTQSDEHAKEVRTNIIEENNDFKPESEGLITPAIIHLIRKINNLDKAEETEELSVYQEFKDESDVFQQVEEGIEETKVEEAIESMLIGLTLLQSDERIPAVDGLITPAIIYLVEKINRKDGDEGTEENKIITISTVDPGFKGEIEEENEEAIEDSVESFVTGLYLLRIDGDEEKEREISEQIDKNFETVKETFIVPAFLQVLGEIKPGKEGIFVEKISEGKNVIGVFDIEDDGKEKLLILVKEGEDLIIGIVGNEEKKEKYIKKYIKEEPKQITLTKFIKNLFTDENGNEQKLEEIDLMEEFFAEDQNTHIYEKSEKFKLIVLHTLFLQAKSQNINLEKIKLPEEIIRSEKKTMEIIILLLLHLLNYSKKDKQNILKKIIIKNLKYKSNEILLGRQSVILFAAGRSIKKKKRRFGLIYQYSQTHLSVQVIL